MMRRGWTVLTGAVLLLVLATGLTSMPVPYVALGPGPTVNTLGTADGKPIIQITGHETSTSRGKLNLTTVSVSGGLDLGTAVRLWIDDDVAVVPRELVYPPDQSPQQTDRQNAEEFRQSQSSAETAALRRLGYPVLVSVAELTEGSPSAGKLRPGDIILSIDGEPVTTRGKLLSLLREHSPGDTVTVEYRRGTRIGTTRVVAGAAPDDPRRAVLGVTVEHRQPHPFEIRIALDKIGGPSAGLMFALGIVDKLDPVDLTGGMFVAGTGTIDDEGLVGPIGGIPQKLVAARRAGATVFLTPAANCAEAAADIPAGLRLVKIETLDQALTALEQLRDGTGSPGGC
ncbi:MAG TPA: PDZ domain-containing protein [Mycobacteriales bacterium]|jgi:PDZ domain-containing protein|nr:PDZ domain-containing protein [Mycobacteriales bacterium]